MNQAEADGRRQRQQLEQQRFEAYEAWQREQAPVLQAREVLDPQGFMYRRAAKLVAEHQEQRVDVTGPDPMTDLLGGARLAAACAEAGLDTSQAIENHYNDIRTAFTEALFDGGHLSEVKTAINQRGEAVINDLTHWELFLRNTVKGDPNVVTAEVAEEFYSAALYQSQYRETHDMYVISPAREDTKGNNLMIRQIRFEPQAEGWQRTTQVLYMANSHLGDIQQLLQELGLATNSKASAMDILAQPLLVNRQKFPEGAVALAQMIDALSTERTGQPVFCGTPLPQAAAYERYKELPFVSRKREAAMQTHIQQFAHESLRLVQSRTLSYEEENARFVRSFITSMQQICADHPEYAEAAFGKQAAERYFAAQAARTQGDTAGADQALAQAIELSHTVDFCDTSISVATAEAVAEVSAFASLETKYGSDNLLKGACVACQKGDERQKLGPCGFCNDCDRWDRLQPGYIQQLVDQQSKVMATEQPTKIELDQPDLPEPTRLRSGQQIELGGQVLEFQQQLVFGGTVPLFKTADGQEITGEAAQQLLKQIA